LWLWVYYQSFISLTESNGYVAFLNVIFKFYAAGIMNSHSDVRLFYVNGHILLSIKISYL
ncbi:hypothetical protein, partial [Klebsiella oxytoca]|uniref:hypothetical protein n=1 Tax=Klebsiella oxytoca TaxID=571 RepID=UPI001BD5492E